MATRGKIRDNTLHHMTAYTRNAQYVAANVSIHKLKAASCSI